MHGARRVRPAAGNEWSPPGPSALPFFFSIFFFFFGRAIRSPNITINAQSSLAPSRGAPRTPRWGGAGCFLGPEPQKQPGWEGTDPPGDGQTDRALPPQPAPGPRGADGFGVMGSPSLKSPRAAGWARCHHQGQGHGGCPARGLAARAGSTPCCTKQTLGPSPMALRLLWEPCRGPLGAEGAVRPCPAPSRAPPPGARAETAALITPMGGPTACPF